MTLVEMLVAMGLLAIIMGFFFFVFLDLANSSTNSVDVSQQEGQVRNIVRILDADLRSADPLTLVPSSFTSAITLPSGTVTSGGTQDTTATDVIAMYEDNDEYAPCSTSTTTTSTVPSIAFSNTFSANVVWAYNKTAHTLTRYSYVTPNSSAASTACQTGGWMSSEVLSNVVNSGGTMFTASQNGGSSSQVTTPSPTTATNQAASACATSVTVLITTKNTSGGQKSNFSVRSVVSLPNQPALSTQSCS